MASIKDLKKRIGSVKNTQQTTKAMKMVSAAKLRRAQDAIINNRPYAKAVGALMDHILRLPNLSVKSKLLDLHGATAEGPKGNLLLVVVTSDRGLCGGFNANLIRYAQRWLRENADRYASIELAFVGKRGFDFFRTKRVKVGEYFDEQGGKVTLQKAQQVAQKLVDRFMTGDVDEVMFLYNEFKNAVTQRPLIDHFLPLRPSMGEGKASVEPSLAIVKPDPTQVLESLLAKHFAIQAFRIMLESQAGEHGARMSAMENATKNAGEMIRKLTLQYNKQRQAGITKELLEIIGGSESQKTA